MLRYGCHLLWPQRSLLIAAAFGVLVAACAPAPNALQAPPTATPAAPTHA